jgi:aspartyl-tRNA(Asn)/glutamyl-tRNA(Gln) amidotransferase subunit C
MSLQQLGYHPGVTSRFSNEDVARLAALARLELTADEITLFAGQLSEILAFAAVVQGVVGPTGPITTAEAEEPAPLRDDIVQSSLERADVLSAAPQPDLAAGLITVPRVFGE